MKGKMIAALLALAFVGCFAMAVFSVVDMSRAWGASATCSIDSLISRDLSLLSALHPDLAWTAYTQSAPRQLASDALSTRTAKAAVLSFLGAPGRIAFFQTLSGRLPFDGELGACALDKDTAFRLFGSIEPGEVSVRLGGESVRVVGVMDVEQPLMLVPAQDHSPGGLTGEAQESKAQSIAFDRLVADDLDTLLTPATVLDAQPNPFELSGAELSKLAWLLCATPWVLAAALVLAALRKRGGGWRIAGSVLLSALSLGALLAVLLSVPVRLLPARWSDLAFYGEQMAAWKTQPFRAPDVRDELLKSDMLRVGLWCAVACIALWMERMWLRCEKSH